MRSENLNRMKHVTFHGLHFASYANFYLSTNYKTQTYKIIQE